MTITDQIQETHAVEFQEQTIHTQENATAAVEMFVEHVECCGEPFKEEILKKVLELKNRDYKILTGFIEELKQSES